MTSNSTPMRRSRRLARRPRTSFADNHQQEQDDAPPPPQRGTRHKSKQFIPMTTWDMPHATRMPTPPSSPSTSSAVSLDADDIRTERERMEGAFEPTDDEHEPRRRSDTSTSVFRIVPNGTNGDGHLRLCSWGTRMGHPGCPPTTPRRAARLYRAFPPAPRSAFELFAAEARQGTTETTTDAQLQQQWNDSSHAERQLFVEAAATLATQYEAALDEFQAQWKQARMRVPNPDLRFMRKRKRNEA